MDKYFKFNMIEIRRRNYENNVITMTQKLTVLQETYSNLRPSRFAAGKNVSDEK